MGKKNSATPSFLRHRTLLGAEAVLVIGLAQELGGRFVQGSSLPNWGKVLFIMIMTLGLLCGLILVMQGLVGKIIGKAYDTAPVPYALMHIGAFAGLFVLYSLTWNLPVFR